jgi:DNA topoisomerase I
MESTATLVRAKWNSLEHKGIAFPPEYTQRGITIRINGERLMLDSRQEEIVYAWAKKKDTHYVTDVIFQTNFLNDFKNLLPERFQTLSKIQDIDFSEAYKLVDLEKKMKEHETERIRNLPREEKKKISLAKKEEREKLKSTYGKAMVDGIEVDVANWLVEPPGLFMGRGQHPLRGRWKPRINPQDVTLNLGENASVPEGTWHKIVHDHSSTWLATWNESLTGKRKYVWLHDSSALRQNNDKEKYDKAAKLEKHIGKVQKEIVNRMLNREINQKKIATVAYLIFKLAMRVGDEKDPEESDTVGASTLRVEHIKFPNHDGQQFIEFNFLGKDSVPWQKTLEISSADTNGLYNNLKLFMHEKEIGSHIFDGITSSKVNAFLRIIDPKNVPGLTAKVFRTYIATKTVKDYLASPDLKIDKSSSQTKKTYVAKMANLKAAITCNHKKGIDPRNPASKKAFEKFEGSIKKKQELVEKLETEIAERNWKTQNQMKKVQERLEKIDMQIKLQRETRDYNLGTSLRNYIDPRVMKAWLEFVDLDWNAVYTATLRRKFKWADDYDIRSLTRFFPIKKETSNQEVTAVQQESQST